MRLRSLLAIPALAAGLSLAACSSPSGGSQAYSPGGGYRPSYAQPAQPSYAQSAPSYAPARSGNTAYIIMTNHCGYCSKLRSNTLPNGMVQAELSALNGQQVDAETSSGRVIASRYGVTGFPTTVVVDPSGAVVKKIVGYYGPDDYVGQLRQAH